MRKENKILEKMKIKIVFRAHICRWTMKSITSKYELKSYTVKGILCNYRKQNDRRNEITKEIRRKSKILCNEYTEIVEGFMNNQKGKRSTQTDIRNHLIHNENIRPISASLIKRILKKKLGYSFKRISTLEHNYIKPFNIRKFFESDIYQIKLEEIILSWYLLINFH